VVQEACLDEGWGRTASARACWCAGQGGEALVRSSRRRRPTDQMDFQATRVWCFVNVHVHVHLSLSLSSQLYLGGRRAWDMCLPIAEVVSRYTRGLQPCSRMQMSVPPKSPLSQVTPPLEAAMQSSVPGQEQEDAPPMGCSLPPLLRGTMQPCHPRPHPQPSTTEAGKSRPPSTWTLSSLKRGVASQTSSAT